MIKLEDLKVGDIIYHAYKYHWIMKIKITKEIQMYENDKDIAYVEGRVTMPFNDNSLHGIDRYNEIELFENYEEAIEYQNKRKQEKINYLMKNNNLSEELFEKLLNLGALTEADEEIYRIVITKKEDIMKLNKINKKL